MLATLHIVKGQQKSIEGSVSSILDFQVVITLAIEDTLSPASKHAHIISIDLK